MPDLEQLPDHQHLEHGADAAGHDDERVGGDHEVMKAGEERLVLERLLDKRIHILLERQLDADANRPGRAGFLRAFVGRLHQAGAAARHDVAAHRGKRRGRALHFVVHVGAGLRAGRTEDRNAVPLAFRRPEPRQVVHDLPEIQHGRAENLLDRLLVGQAHEPCRVRWVRCA